MTAAAFAARSSHAFARLWRGTGALAVALFDRLLAWQARARERRWLAAMDDRQLRDLGIDRTDALEEARKPFWRD